MSRLRVPALALLACLAMGMTLAGCGESDDELLPGDNAQQILANLEEVEALAADGQCSSAEDAIDQVADQIENLPGSVNERLRNNLRSGVNRLREVTAESCGAVELDPADETTPVPEVPEPEEDTQPEDTTGDDDEDPSGGTGPGRGQRGGQGGGGQGNQGGGGNQGQGGGNQGAPGGGENRPPQTPATPAPPDSGGISPGEVVPPGDGAAP